MQIYRMSRLDAGARILFRDRRRSDSGALSYKQMVGREIGNYRIVEIIGAGGMGVVYKAIDTNLDRMVAVKALSPEFSGNPALLDRFRGEARAQAQLNHPNLATLYAFLVQEDVAYMVMEYVDGETFHAMVAQRGPIPAAEAIPLFRQALAGIGHAHSQGIVHRDIKPSNIMLNRAGVVKVMDFGLAKVSGGHGVTRTGVRLGTAYYFGGDPLRDPGGPSAFSCRQRVRDSERSREYSASAAYALVSADPQRDRECGTKGAG
jgi:serine/threonine protein kinase